MLTLRELSLEALDGRSTLSAVNLHLPPGGNLILTGASARERYRLLKVMAGTEHPSAGSVQVGGVEVWPGKGSFALAGKVKVGFAFARGGLLANLTLQDNVALPLRFLGLPLQQIASRVTAALDVFGLGPVAGLRPHAISDAGRKHANLARVLALEPALLLLDDPLNGLEGADRSMALGLIHSWSLQPQCTLVIAAEEGAAYASIDAVHHHLAPVPYAVESA